LIGAVTDFVIAGNILVELDFVRAGVQRIRPAIPVLPAG